MVDHWTARSGLKSKVRTPKTRALRLTRITSRKDRNQLATLSFVQKIFSELITIPRSIDFEAIRLTQTTERE